jgi:hypothetical protein
VADYHFAVPGFWLSALSDYGASSSTHSTKSEKIAAIVERSRCFLRQDQAALKAFQKEHPEFMRSCVYLQREGFPVYRNTDCQYFSQGEQQYAALIADLKNAEKFILWNTLSYRTENLGMRFMPFCGKSRRRCRRPFVV